MKVAIPILFALSFFSCSPSFFCRKCLESGNKIPDTLSVIDTTKTKGSEANATFEQRPVNFDSLRNSNPDEFESLPCPELPPVMEVKNGTASATIKQTDKGLDVKVKCDPEIIIKEIKVPVVTEVHTGYTLIQIILACLATAGLVALLFLFRR